MNNVGKTDRIIRLVVAVVLAALWGFGIVQGWLGIVLLVVAGVLLLTALFGTCPLYSLLGISSNTANKHKA
jgi:fatty acid desaturase